MSRIPELPAGFTAPYLTELLRADGCLPAAGEVTSVSQQLIGDGTGMSSELAMLGLTYSGDQGEAPDRLVAKFLPTNEINRASALAFNLPEREVRYAAELDPQTDAITPKTYCALFDGHRFLILMEDLSDYQVGNQEVGATLKQTELAIDELAKLHSAFWNRMDGIDWVPGIADSYHADALAGASRMGWENMIERFELPDAVTRYMEPFLASVRALQAERMQAPITLVHGDFRMENLFFGQSPEQHPIIVFDWQGPLKARGMFDVSLFLGQSTTTEVRRAHERSLLERYLEGLQAGGVTDVDMDMLWEDYRRCMLYDWLYTAVVSGTLDIHNDAARRWMTQMVNRHAAASEDLEVFQFLPR